MNDDNRASSPLKLFRFLKKLRLYEILLIALVVAILMVWGVKKTTESAIFCGNSCHVMRPHYDEWKISAHNDVPCIKCHIPPLENPSLYPDFRALGQVLSYLTRTYGRYTRAEVDDTSCLREGCHSRRLLEGRVTYAADISFNHTPHLQQLRRGKILRCTTCHARNVMGEHISVIHDTCFICHFKGDRSRLYTAQCHLCHPMDKLSGKEALGGFKHDPYIERTVPCGSCHAGIISGNGQLDEKSCARCHGPSAADLSPEPVERLHSTHVTQHKVECGVCHLPIRHEMRGEAVDAPPECDSCHENRHAGITNMYRGTGAQGVPSKPSPMFMASVACIGCHSLSTASAPGETPFRGDTLFAVESACSQCHGEDMSGYIENWTAEITDALTGAERALRQAESYIEGLKKDSVYQDFRLVLGAARHNLLFVRASSPIHNSGYAVTILEKTAADLEGLMETDRQR